MWKKRHQDDRPFRANEWAVHSVRTVRTIAGIFKAPSATPTGQRNSTIDLPIFVASFNEPQAHPAHDFGYTIDINIIECNWFLLRFKICSWKKIRSLHSPRENVQLRPFLSRNETSLRNEIPLVLNKLFQNRTIYFASGEDTKHLTHYKHNRRIM